ncbi:non-hydrolyzing UDP-N-acetylglucosamine 2-epimerase [Eleftheria terrae]|uniref:non-hydrolyzing UDP-N-acetylglucosamine 2-epimerase n=1 Tax=Eleftheria terrae TaxID=1597781 RepID=UPI00263BDEF3|nr:UDP-N-acetylglucosamine 2-epimerase (non-hydrolyzing) [Eleftheria terrae]WKB51085.1 UDP-N-acetylglucosamine 2-epimerase (non-hydrolyzing) [Eleftheria terrae]
MKILTVVGARPQFIKAAAVSRAIAHHNEGRPRRAIEEVIVHTGQHFDHNMSQTFFDELSIPAPKHHLSIHGGGHGQMTGRMLEQLEAVLLEEQPEWVLVYGDTNSTLAGALAAVKLHIPVAHVEAGLRSFNMRMPEEVNRIVADRISSLLLCPTAQAVANLRREGMAEGVFHVGDVMYDAAMFYGDRAAADAAVLNRLQLKAGEYVLATCHRAENTDDPLRLCGIADALNELSKLMPVVLPLHPRTRKTLQSQQIALLPGVRVCDPVSFLEMVCLERAARLIVTDSGGVQKEAYFYGVPCVTMRDETEWVETVHAGWNRLAGARCDAILEAVTAFTNGVLPPRPPLYGDGNAGASIVTRLAAQA